VLQNPMLIGTLPTVGHDPASPQMAQWFDKEGGKGRSEILPAIFLMQLQEA
jgi:hypothetical protein